jgi:hypothetical protein
LVGSRSSLPSLSFPPSPSLPATSTVVPSLPLFPPSIPFHCQIR